MQQRLGSNETSGASAARDPVLTTAVVAFTLLAFLVGSVHEPWADEAQAWLIARDATLHNLLFQLPHAEMNPSLWHLMLILPSTYLSYETLRYIALFFGTLGVLLFVYYSPFPKPVKIILPFTYFVFFQYTVVARSYCLFALVIFAIAILYKHRFERPFTYSVLIALLVYTHSFGALASTGLIGMYVLDLLREKRFLSKQAVIRNLACISIPLSVGCFLLYQVFPIRQRTLSTRWYFDLDHTLYVLKLSLNESFTGITVLSLLILLISMFWFWQRRVLLLYVAMVTPVVTVFSIKFYNYWHMGLLFLLWVLALWISFESKTKSRVPSIVPYTRKIVLGCMYVVFGFHVYWSAAASYADYKGSYSCGRDVAQLLKHSGIKERRVYAKNFWSIAALPYFEGKMFYNINPEFDFGYWTFFEPDRVDDMNMVLASRPDAIVIARQHSAIDFDGYVRHNFNGSVFWKDRINESNHCTVYIREDLDQETPKEQ